MYAWLTALCGQMVSLVSLSLVGNNDEGIGMSVQVYNTTVYLMDVFFIKHIFLLWVHYLFPLTIFMAGKGRIFMLKKYN